MSPLRRAHPIALFAGIVATLGGLVLVAVGQKIDGVTWPGVGVLVGGIAVLLIATLGFSRTRGDDDAIDSEMPPKYVPGIWYPVVLLGIFVIVLFILKVPRP